MTNWEYRFELLSTLLSIFPFKLIKLLKKQKENNIELKLITRKFNVFFYKKSNYLYIIWILKIIIVIYYYYYYFTLQENLNMSKTFITFVTLLYIYIYTSNSINSIKTYITFHFISSQLEILIEMKIQLRKSRLKARYHWTHDGGIHDENPPPSPTYFAHPSGRPHNETGEECKIGE